jgi:hypothetical protein
MIFSPYSSQADNWGFLCISLIPEKSTDNCEDFKMQFDKHIYSHNVYVALTYWAKSEDDAESLHELTQYNECN